MTRTTSRRKSRRRGALPVPRETLQARVAPAALRTQAGAVRVAGALQEGLAEGGFRLSRRLEGRRLELVAAAVSLAFCVVIAYLLGG